MPKLSIATSGNLRTGEACDLCRRIGAVALVGDAGGEAAEVRRGLRAGVAAFGEGGLGDTGLPTALETLCDLDWPRRRGMVGEGAAGARCEILG